MSKTPIAEKKGKEMPSLKAFDTQRTPPPALLKWIGSKHQIAPIIVSHMPLKFSKYIEPFLGSGAILGALAPAKAIAGDTLLPLIEIWQMVQKNPANLLEHYAKTWNEYKKSPKGTYERIKESYNREPNPYDLLFISRACYGGVIRFTKEGKLSTPVGVHNPISPKTLAKRVQIWQGRISGTCFVQADFSKTMESVSEGDLVYCDPPYQYSQQILYGSQNFRIPDLWESIRHCKRRGAKVMLSIDGKVKSGSVDLRLSLPKGLFESELFIPRGSSMLRRFQKKGKTMEGEIVHDRLLLTWYQES